MSDILIKAGTIDPVFQLEASSPWSIRFRDADDFLMPFDGTLVLPGVPLEPIDFDHIGTREWMTLSLRYPQLGAGNSRRFPSLRDMNNRAVVTDKPVIIFIANDYSFFADYHPGSFFSDIRDTYDPVFKNNYTICTTAKYFLFEFDEGVFSGINILPVDLAPFACSKDFALKTNGSTDSGLTALRNVLAGAATLNGKVRAFDLSGRETETYSALLNLGIVKTAIDNSPSDAGEKTIKIQFVDIHGEPLRNTVFPLQMIDTDPGLVVSSIPGDPPFCEFTFTTDERKIKFRLKTEGSVPDAFPVSYYFHHVALWPGYNFRLKEIKNATEWTSLDLIDEIEPAELRPLTFARICLFNPLSEFQMTAGGLVEDRSYTNLAGEFQKRYKFRDNDQYIFTPFNKVDIYNCAADFFEDYHKLVGALKENDRVYQVNWQSHPFTHLTGSMSVRSIASNDADTGSIEAALIKSRESFILLPVKIKGKDMPDEEWRVIYLSSAVNGNGVFSGDLQTIISTIPGPGEFASQVQRTFVRGNFPFAWLLKPRTVSATPVMASDILPHRVRASWKTRSGAVFSTVLDDLLGAGTQPVTMLPDFDPGTISIETNGGDPARLQLRRLKAMTNVSSEGDSACLLVINLVAGCVCLLPLNPPGASAVSDNVIITTAEAYPEDSIEKKAIELLTGTFSGEDELVFAICKAPPSPDVAWDTLLITGCWYFHFPNDAIRLGDLPVHEEEVAGVFRKAIFNNVKVRAMYWDQYLAQFSGGDAMLAGLSNNQSIANIINKDIGGKHGYAVLDRATRDFGSWHQKSSVIIQKDPDDTIVMPDKKDLLISYVGGMDLALGRWDTQEHYQFDPDRQTGLWYDVHVKIEGEAGFDVLRNFAHRWKANGVFLGSGFENVRPVNVSPVLEADLTAAFHIPDPGDIKIPSAGASNAFVQINRTIPPRSCLSLPGVSASTGVTIPDEAGELGSLASYTRAIAQARKFIIINEQYFFSQEFALKLHERMTADDGPEFLIIVLPLVLNESDYIDPNLFQARKLAIDTLYYGATVGTPGPGGTLCGRIVPPATGNNKVKDRVAILTPVNTERSAVYVHAKHTIVDDVWMSVGSANMGSRSLTFDGEINAAVVGNGLYKGQMSLISNHRIEICRQLLGLPDSYSALLQDPYAAFRLFKAIELQQESYSFRLHPQPLHTKWLDPLFKVKVGEAAFDSEVDAVATLNFTDPSFSFLICNALDPDGRSNQPIRLAFFAAFAGIGKTVPSATANITFSFSPAADAAIRAAVTGGSNYHFIVKMTITTETSTETRIAGPFVVADYPLRISTITSAIVLDQPGETSDVNTVAFPISVTDKYKATIEIQDQTATTPGPVQFSAEEVFDPSTASPVITHGSVRDITVVLA